MALGGHVHEPPLAVPMSASLGVSRHEMRLCCLDSDLDTVPVSQGGSNFAKSLRCKSWQSGTLQVCRFASWLTGLLTGKQDVSQPVDGCHSRWR